MRDGIGDSYRKQMLSMDNLHMIKDRAAQHVRPRNSHLAQTDSHLLRDTMPIPTWSESAGLHYAAFVRTRSVRTFTFGVFRARALG